MTVTATVHVTDHPDRSYVASDKALEAIRFGFNPSTLEGVTRLKALAALFLSECSAVFDRNPDAGHEIGVAMEHAITASMWAVLAATKDQ
jgi:hypothetical protein